MLATFRHKALVIQDASTGAYRLGPACFHLVSSLVDGRAGFPFDAEHELEDLRTQTGETVTVHVRSGLSRICIHELPSHQSIRYTAGLGATAGIHVGSAGKVLMAFMGDDERADLLRELDLRAATPATIVDMDTLVLALHDVRARGFAVSIGERVLGAIGVSAPVFDPGGRILAALSVLGPESRMSSLQIDRSAVLTRAAASRITARTQEGTT
jgi:IclR family acetate operon transcriptional repressor